MKEGRKEQAISCVKKKVSYEKMINVTSSYYDNIVRLINEIEQASITVDVTSILEGANETLGVVLEDLNPQRLEQLRDSIEDKFGQMEVCFP